MQQTLRNFIMNSKNSMKRILVFFIPLISVTLFACTAKSASPSSPPIEEGSIIDSIMIDFNKDGKLDKIFVTELNEMGNRQLIVQLFTKNGYQTIQKNKEIIPCKTCGVQSGNPYIGMEEIKDGFRLFLEFVNYDFLFQKNALFLNKIDLLQTKDTEEGIEEYHEVYTSSDFGTINLSKVPKNIILSLQKQKTNTH